MESSLALPVRRCIPEDLSATDAVCMELSVVLDSVIVQSPDTGLRVVSQGVFT